MSSTEMGPDERAIRKDQRNQDMLLLQSWAHENPNLTIVDALRRLNRTELLT